MAETPYRCPLCDADLTGDDIEPRFQQFYGLHTTYSRAIGVYDRELDRTVGWRCPDCRGEWAREWA